MCTLSATAPTTLSMMTELANVRSPEVVCLYQVVSLIMANSVLLHWLLLSNGQTLPCPVVQFVSYLGEQSRVSCVCDESVVVL